jgi:inorganic pyrophosphatase
VAANSRNHHDVRSLDALHGNLVDEIEHFFVSYNQIAGKRFTPLQRAGVQRARALIRQAERRFQAARDTG